jgi:hypothetical protein
MMNSLHAVSELPRLAIVHTRSLVLHEEVDPKRSEPLANRLRAEGALKNPPVVAPVEREDRYVVLDGTNRVVALSVLAYPHVVVQIVDYDDPDLVLDTWFHLITGMSPDEFASALHTLDGMRMEIATHLHARAELARRQATAYAMLPAAHAPAGVHLLYVDGGVHRRAAVLTRLVNLYQARGHIQRVNTDNLEALLPLYHDVSALVVFPRYEPSEIMELARQGAYLPAGITRHVVPGRALRLNFPLKVLLDDRSLDEKNAWLQDWLRAKLAGKEVRYYQESTYLFDE